jgi:hypothetical protein
MESLALLAVVIVLSVAFVGAFVGFVIADNTDSTAVSVLVAAVPAVGVALFTSVPATGIFWLIGYVLGYIVGFWMNCKRR